MSTPFVTIDEAKQAIGIRSVDTSYDAHLSALIDMAVSDIETATRRTFDYGVHTETFNTSDTRYHSYDVTGWSGDGLVERGRVREYDLAGVNLDDTQPFEVRYDPYRKFGDDTIMDPENYVVDWENATLTVLGGTRFGIKTLLVSYTAGYQPGASGTLSENLPSNLKSACLLQVAFLYKRHKSDNIGLNIDRGVDGQKSRVSDARWNTQMGLCKEAQHLVRSYRRVLMGRG